MRDCRSTRGVRWTPGAFRELLDSRPGMGLLLVSSWVFKRADQMVKRSLALGRRCRPGIGKSWNCRWRMEGGVQDTGSTGSEFLKKSPKER
jgi:hypothetical protein